MNPKRTPASSNAARRQPGKPVRDERMKVEISAGGIVFKRTPQGVRVAFVMDPYGKWTFAKGHVEAGEALEAAALRETREEMGLGRLRVVAPLGSIDIWFRDRYRPATKGVLIHKYVHYFLMEAPSRAKGSPQRKEKIRRIIWVGTKQVMRTSSYEDVKHILRQALEILGRPKGRSADAVGAPAPLSRTSVSSPRSVAPSVPAVAAESPSSAQPITKPSP